ncbi:MAG: sulfotransferase [Gallionella sp.]
MSSSAPIILLFGMPRSGTTWVGKIFDSHPDTLYRHEPDSWGLLNSIPIMAQLALAEDYSETLRAFSQQLPAMRQTKVAGSTPIFPKRYYSWARFNLYRLSVAAAKSAAKFAGELPVQNFIREQDLSGIRVVWKSIESLGRLGVISRALTPCYGFHIVRHPCGYVASVMRGESQARFTSNVASSEDYGIFKKCLDTDTARQYSITLDRLKSMHPVERLAWRWVLYNAKAMADIDNLPICMTFRYEDLCKDPHGVAQRLFLFCGLSWQAQTERFVTQSTAKDVGRYYSVVKDPVKAANKWRNQLSVEDIDRVFNVVAGTRPGTLYPRD